MKTCPQCGYNSGRPQRSNQQNRYFHGVVLDRLANSEIGYTKDEWKEILKNKFLKKWVTLKDRYGKLEEMEITQSTTELNTKQFEDFMTSARQWASTLGVWVPEPNEVLNVE